MTDTYGCADNQSKLSVWFRIPDIEVIAKAILEHIKKKKVDKEDSNFRITFTSDINSEESGGELGYDMGFEEPEIVIATGVCETGG